MRIDRAGLPFIIGAFVPAAALLLLGQWIWALPLVVLAAFFLFFFRDPDRQVPDGSGVVVAPADGRVVHAGEADPTVAPPGAWRQVSIFLSPLDVHVNRMPVDGRVTAVTYQPGRFLAAYRPEAASENERCEVRLDHDGRLVVCRQVVGVLARRIVCRVAPGAHVRRGERFGIMKFGSRMDVFLPVEATLEVVTGQPVWGGETVIARLAASDVGGAAETSA